MIPDDTTITGIISFLECKSVFCNIKNLCITQTTHSLTSLFSQVKKLNSRMLIFYHNLKL